MKLRETYANCKAKEYNNLKEFFVQNVEFSKENVPNKIEEISNSSRVWLLFASLDKNDWKCLQVAHSKNGVQSEIKDVIEFLFCNAYQNAENISYTNSAFYEKVCPKTTNEPYRRLLYSKIGSEYKYFRICFLDVDKYLGTKPDNDSLKSDSERIIQICKNQYAEAKIAYQTLAVYWRLCSSGIDGQTIAYIAGHFTEFEE
ncbi:MAG: hypothetical protein J6C64_11960 [Lachnospiraceae bacterium]|nr:hypothetical protein [Lachnospiraceae bacterium]